MFEPVWTRVVTGSYQSQPATVKGFKRYAVIGQDFPVIVPGDQEDSLDGVLHLNVSGDDLARLDEFESYFYFRQTVTVSSKETLLAEVYVLSPEYAHVASDELWSPYEFKKSGLDRFIERFA